MENSEKSHYIGRHAGKDELRDQIWTALKESGDAIDNPFGGISNFVGADIAAASLAEMPLWKLAKVVKCNPDAPQSHARLRALQDGKILYMAVPRLAEEKCFIELTSEDLMGRGIALEDASQWQTAVKIGKRVSFEEMKSIDLAVTGCVAVTRAGGRTGKGAGFADLEFAMLRQSKLLSPEAPIVTTVHSLMVVDNDRLPLQPHDTFLNWIITPEEIIEVKDVGTQPGGIDWDRILTDQYESIPVLRKLKPDWTSKK